MKKPRQLSLFKETTEARSARISAAWTPEMRARQGQKTKELWERGTFDRVPLGRRKCMPSSCANAVSELRGMSPSTTFILYICKVCGKEEWKHEGG